MASSTLSGTLSEIQVKRISKIKFSLFHFKQIVFLNVWNNIIVEKEKDKCSSHLAECLEKMKEFGEFKWSNGHYHKFIIIFSKKRCPRK